MTKPLLLAITSCLAVLPLASTQAVLIGYEPFDYASLTSGTPTTAAGFTGSWTSNGAASTIQPNLTYSTLPTEDSAVRPGAGQKAFESFTTPVTSGTLYYSFLIKGGGDSGGVSVGAIFSGSSNNLFVGFGSGFSATDTRFGTGLVSGAGGYTTATSFTATASPISNTATHYIVVAIDFDFSGSNERIRLWIDPTVANVAAGTPGTAAQTRTNLNLGNLTGIGFQGDGILPTIDEFRIGTSFADVAGVTIPEPSTYALIGIGLVTGIIGFRRRRA